MTADDIRARIETVERSYELFLAFAAQGVRDDTSSPQGGELRGQLTKLSEALDGLGDGVASLAQTGALGPEGPAAVLAEALARDAATSRAMVELVLSRPAISSQLIDNLNATIHIRALLTDLFLVDELLPRE